MFYWLGKSLARVVCRVFGRWQVFGRENIPKKGGVMLCGNHASYIDPPAMSGAASRTVHFMAKSELFKIPILGFLMKHVRAFPVKRGVADRGALKKATDYLQNGEVVGMFPEGTRNPDPSKLMKPEPGVGMIVLRAEVPVIPVALVNTHKLLPLHSVFFHFTRVKIIFGPPVPLDDLYGQSGREAVEEAGRRIMAGIEELIESAGSR